MNPFRLEQGPLDTVRSLATSRARVTTGTAGAIVAANTITRGLTVVKTAAKVGRYTVQVVDAAGASVPLFRALEIRIGVISPTADAAITTDKGAHWVLRTLSEANGLFYLQFLKSLTSGANTTYVDAELEDTSVFTIAVVSERNEVTP